MKEDQFSPTTMDKILLEWKAWQKENAKRRKDKRREYSRYYGMAAKIQRARRGITQVHLAEILGVHKSHLAKIEIGKILPGDRLHRLIVQALREHPEVVYDKHFHVPRSAHRS